MAYFKAYQQFIVFLIVLGAFTAPFEEGYGFEKQMDVLTRKGKTSINTKIIKKVLSNLTAVDEFSGKHFSIYYQNEETPVKFSHQDKQLVLKAASVYYHLEYARTFWLSKVGVGHLNSLSHVAVRLDMNEESIENTYRTVESKNEIWFGKLKKVDTSTMDNYYYAKPAGDLAGLVVDPINSVILSSLNTMTLEKILYPIYAPEHFVLMGMAHVLGMVVFNVLINNVDLIDRFLGEEQYYRDSAMIPETVFSSFSFLLFQGIFKNRQVNPVTKGLLDFYSAEMIESNRIQKQLAGYSNERLQGFFRTSKYNSLLELDQYGNYDYVFSILQTIKKKFKDNYFSIIMGANNIMVRDNPLIYQDLLSALLQSCERYCHQPFADKLKLREIFQRRGL